jgi:hypothetical protein
MSVFRGELVRHAGSPESPVERIIVAVARTGVETTITYDVTGDLPDVAFPEIAPSERRDGLWTATCFELFVRHPGKHGYLEWNFAPSTAWAAYAFDGYRAGMRNADVAAPMITSEADDTRYRMIVNVAIDAAPWQIGLSAVIRDRDGNTSYWALAHPAGKADFHHADCFAAEL